MKLFSSNYSNYLEAPDKYKLVVGVYLHGELERSVGFDLVCSLGGSMPYGEYPVTVHADNETYECIAFVWESNDLKGWKRGLVCDIKDSCSISYAKDMCREKAQSI
jgi:hypothetical protein